MIFKYEHTSLGVYVCIIMILYVHEMRYIYITFVYTYIVLSCLFALGVNVSNYLVLGKTSPLTYQVAPNPYLLYMYCICILYIVYCVCYIACMDIMLIDVCKLSYEYIVIIHILIILYVYICIIFRC